MNVEPAMIDAPVDFGEHPVTRRRGEPPDEPAAGREAAIGANEMLTAKRAMDRPITPPLSVGKALEEWSAFME